MTRFYTRSTRITLFASLTLVLALFTPEGIDAQTEPEKATLKYKILSRSEVLLTSGFDYRREAVLSEPHTLYIRAIEGNGLFVAAKGSRIPMVFPMTDQVATLSIDGDYWFTPRCIGGGNGNYLVDAVGVQWTFQSAGLSFSAGEAVFTSRAAGATIRFTKEGVRVSGFEIRLPSGATLSVDLVVKPSPQQPEDQNTRKTSTASGPTRSSTRRVSVKGNPTRPVVWKRAPIAGIYAFDPARRESVNAYESNFLEDEVKHKSKLGELLAVAQWNYVENRWEFRRMGVSLDGFGLWDPKSKSWTYCRPDGETVGTATWDPSEKYWRFYDPFGKLVMSMGDSTR